MMATISVSTAAQKNEFLARLARIESGAGSSKSTLFVGLDETILVDNKAKAKILKKAAATPQKRLGPVEAVLCAVLGLASLIVAHYILFSIANTADPRGSPDMEMAVNGGLGLTIALFLGYFLRMPLLKMAPICTVGVMAGVVAFHNLVHFYPEKFADVFSPLWVEQVVTATAANSIIWRGVSFTL